MSQWSYVIAAYGVTLAGLAVLIVASFSAMRRAERRVAELSRQTDRN